MYTASWLHQEFIASVNSLMIMCGNVHLSGAEHQTHMITGYEVGNRLYSDFDVVAITASYGGIEAFHSVLSTLPPNFPLPVILLLHVGDQFSDSFPKSLARTSNLPVKWAEHDEQLHAGQIYVAPPGVHLSVDAHLRFVLSRTPKVRFCRPSADVLFASLAVVFKKRLIAVVLTGYGSDGAVGANLVKSMEGRLIVQDQATSSVADMPAAAIRTSSPDFILPLYAIGPAVVALTMVPGAAELLARGEGCLSHTPQN